MFVNEKHRSLKIGVVEFIGNAETKWSELSSLLYAGVEEADREDKGSPLVVWFDLLKEVLVYHSVEGSGKTSLESLWWLSCYLNGHLEKTKREVVIWQAGDPKSEVFMDFSVLRVKDVFHFSHELKTKMTVI